MRRVGALASLLQAVETEGASPPEQPPVHPAKAAPKSAAKAMAAMMFHAPLTRGPGDRQSSRSDRSPRPCRPCRKAALGRLRRPGGR